MKKTILTILCAVCCGMLAADHTAVYKMFRDRARPRRIRAVARQGGNT